jgi:acyl carrier protein
MDRQVIFQTIEGLVKLRSGLKSNIAPDARFKEDLEIDSLLVVDIVIDLEQTFHISIPEDAIADVSSLNAAVALVERLHSESRADGGGGEEQSQSRLLGSVRHIGQPGQ